MYVGYSRIVVLCEVWAMAALAEYVSCMSHKYNYYYFIEENPTYGWSISISWHSDAETKIVMQNL